MRRPVQVRDRNRNVAAAPEGAAQQQQDANQPDEPSSGEDSDASDGNGPAAAKAPGRVTRSGRQTTSGFREIKSGKQNRTKKHHHKREIICKQELNESYLESLDWTRVKGEFRTADWGLFVKLIDGNEEDGLIEYMHLMSLQIKASPQDNFWYHEAMNGQYAEEFWTASEEELETLEVKRESWDIVDRMDEMNVLKSIWAMKMKRFPNGLIKKFKARLCVRGDMQIEGVDFFDTYAPVQAHL
eukprot:scaffold7531_cov66-Attheya_sp.AAC.2